jgi:hypothetical protein
MEATPQLTTLFGQVAAWPGTVLNSHKSASQTFHALSFLSDLGVSPDHPAIAAALGAIMDQMGNDGIPRLPMTYPVHFGGSGHEQWCWALCDAPVILKALVRFGLLQDQRVARGVAQLLDMARSFGWPCAVSPELGSFRGPGRKDDPCPFATLACLDLAIACGGLAAHPAVLAGIEALLSCWERSRDWHPYIFYAGTDFRKLKAPFIWYDILHVCDALSYFPVARSDPRFLAMLAVIHDKRQDDGSYFAESVYQPFKTWDFGQKKLPSPWIGLMVARIESRLTAE